MEDFVKELGVSEWTDEQCLGVFLNLLKDRVEIGTGFLVTEPSNFITHQVIEIKCGELTTSSGAEALEIPLQLADVGKYIPKEMMN